MADGYISQIKTLDNKTYLLRDNEKISTINASGTAPLTLSGSKSETTYTLTGSIADASASASGIVNTDAQTFSGVKTFDNGLHIYGTISTQGTGSAAGTIYPGGAYHSGHNSIILHGDTAGISGIGFTSEKATKSGTTTNINGSSDRAFIQYHAYGVTPAAEGTAPTLATSGELGTLVIGVGNDATDTIRLQAPGTAGILHQIGATAYPIPHTTNTNGSVGGTTTPIYVEAGVIKAGTALGTASQKAESYFVKAVASTDNAIVRFDGTSGQVQKSGITIDDSDNMTIGSNRILNQTAVPGQGEILLSVFGFKTGYPLYTDPTFVSGMNSIGVYNNSGGGTVTHTRGSYTSFEVPSPGTDSSSIIKIETTGTASPGCGGFYQNIPARANAQFVQIFRALVPADRKLYTASNTMGTGYKDEWLTSNNGTGKWEWYARRVICGQEGTMSGGGHIYIDGSIPVTWYLASCNIYDITKTEYDGLKTRYADAANLTSTTNAVAYYTDTAGTFGSKASANGALYATSANGALQWGILPIAQGGTGKTNANDAANTLISGLPAWTANPTDDTYLIRRDTGGTATYGQVKFSTVWNYIKGKADSVYANQTTVNGLLAAADAMIFKGIINATDALPNSHNAGDTYRVGTAGTYPIVDSNGRYCEVGTLIICIADGTAANAAHWTSVETNEDGAVIGPANSTDNAIARFDGATGRIIQNSGITINDDGNLVIAHATSATMTTASTNPQIIFSENGTQPVHLIYSDYDSYRSPAGLKIIGGTSASPAWLEVEGNIYAAAFKGHADSATSANYINLYEARGTTTTLNKAANYIGAGKMFHLVASSNTSATDNGKTPTDANILQMNWDNSGGYDAQLGIATGANRMYFRSRPSQKIAWDEVAHAPVGTAGVGNATQPVYMTSEGVITAGTALKALAYKDSLTSSDIPDNAANTTGNAATATAIQTAGTTAQFYRGDNSWSNILKQTATSALGIDTNRKIGTAIKDLHFTVGSGSGTGINDGNAGGITIGTDTASYGGIYWQSSGSYGLRLHFATTGSFANGAYTRMLITHDGKVGIGTLTPDTLLTVNGNAKADKFIGALQGNADTATNATNHIARTDNPHNVTSAQLGLGNVENTKLSTWTGSTNITTLGTITTGTWNGTAIANNKLANSSLTVGNKSINLGASGTIDEIITYSTTIGQNTSWDVTDSGAYPAYYSSGFSGDQNPGTNQNAPYSYGTLYVMRANTAGAAQFYISHHASSAKNTANGIRYRSGWDVTNAEKTAAQRWEAWATILDDKNYNLYSPKLDGTGATGSWGINITGNAANVTGTVAIGHGGTGATSAADARTNLGLGTIATKADTAYIKFGGDDTGLGGSSPAATAKTYWADATKVSDNMITGYYNHSGTEYSLLFSKRSTYGSILKWGYGDRYLRILRVQSGTWKSTDWEKIDAGYADSAGTATSAGKWTTARTLTIGNKGQSVDGSGNVSWSLADIGAAPSSTISCTAANIESALGIDFITNTGALNSNGWKTLGGRNSGAKIAISYASSSPATWNSSAFSASLVFGCNDTRGLLDLSYITPVVTFGGASVNGSTDNDPKWYFKLSATSGQTYTLPSSSKTLAASDGSNTSGTWGISITGSSASCTGNAATATSASYLSTPSVATEANIQDGTRAYQGSGSGWTGSVASMAYAGILQVCGGYSRGWQIWATRGDNATQSLHWRNPNNAANAWNEERIILDSGNYTDYAVAKTAGVTAVTWDSTNKKLTRTINGTAADVVTAATLRTDLELSNALHFIGITSTTLTDGSTTSTLTAKSTGSLTKTTGFVDGDVVMDGDQLREYVWSGSAWRLLGITTSTAYTQPASTATNTWIAQVSQGTDGKITATTGSLNTSGTWSGTASKATTTANTSDSIYPVGVKSGATTTLLHDTSITMKGNAITAVTYNSTAASLTSETSTTANTAKYATLTLGNNANVNTTTAHSEGQIVMYSAATQAHTIKGTSTTTAYTHTLPNNTGLLVSLSGGTAKGSSTKPVYIPNTGIVTECSTYAGGTKVTFNGADKGASTASFYAPTAGGTAGHVLIGAGTTAAPVWYGGTVMSGSAAADWKTAFNGTTDATASNAAAVTIAGGLGIAKSIIVGETATITNNTRSPKFTLTVNDADKAYLQYNTTDNSIDFIFV